MVDPQEQDRLRNLYEQQKVGTTTMKSEQSSGLNQFLKKPNPNLDKLKQQYFAPEQDKNSAFKSEQKIRHWSDIENYIDK